VSTQTSNWQSLLQTLAGADKRISLVVTGGGSGAVTHCLRRAGASRNFVDAVIPYSRAAVTDYLGCPPVDSSASSAVAKQLAAVALRHATELDDGSDAQRRDAVESAGIALVAALPTTPPRRGQDRIHVALQTAQRGVLWSLELPKDAHTRETAETVADEMVFLALAELAGHAHNDPFFENAGLDLVCVP
jgi:hypothetical protein